MVAKKTYFFGVLFWGLGCQCYLLAGDFDFNLKKSVVVQTIFTGQYHVVVDLGELPAGKKGEVLLTLTNPNNVRFPVDKIDVGCNCGSARFVGDALEPNSVGQLILNLKTPKSSRRVVSSVGIALGGKEPNAKMISLAVRYKLAGLLGFMDRMVIQEVSKSLEQEESLIPIIVTDPVTRDDVRIEIVPDGIQVSAIPVVRDGRTFVRLSFRRADVPPEGVTFSLIARVRNGDAGDECIVSLNHRKELEVSPSTLRFQRSEKQIISSCILRCRTPLGEFSKTNSANADTPQPVSMSASLAGNNLRVRAKRIGRGIFRVHLSGDRDRLEKAFQESGEGPVSVRWNVITNEQTFSAVSRATLLSTVMAGGEK